MSKTNEEIIANARLVMDECDKHSVEHGKFMAVLDYKLDRLELFVKHSRYVNEMTMDDLKVSNPEAFERIERELNILRKQQSMAGN